MNQSPFFQHTKVVTEYDIQALLKRCQEYERNGWECISPIKEVEYNSKQYNVRRESSTRGNSKFVFAGVNQVRQYRCVYKYKG